MELLHGSEAARLARRGLREAVAAISPDEHPHVVVGRAVFWASALDEMLWSLPGYQDARDDDPDGAATRGARFARNAITHGAVVATTPGGLTIPFSIPFSIPAPTWAAGDAIRAVWTPHRKKETEAEEAAYREHFETLDLKSPLLRVEAWLDQCQLGGFLLA